MTTILVPISPGELVDKIVILEIKEGRIKDSPKLANIHHELELLRVEFAKLPVSTELSVLKERLKQANETVWDSEESVREHRGDDAETLRQARISHAGNDERYHLKRRINELLGSNITEEKSHQ